MNDTVMKMKYATIVLNEPTATSTDASSAWAAIARAGVPHFAGDLRHLPPSAEREERRDQRTCDRPDEWWSAGTSRGKRNEMAPVARRVEQREGDQPEYEGELDHAQDGQQAGAGPDARNVDDRERHDRADPDHSERDGPERNDEADVAGKAGGEGGCDTGIHHEKAPP